MSIDSVAGFGYFDDERQEFVLNNPRPPKPWLNSLWNRSYNSQPSQCGGGISYRRDDDGTIVLLNWSGEKYFYLLDEDSGEYFSLGYQPVCNDACERFQCRYGLGYHIVSQRCLGLETKITTTVPLSGHRELYEIQIRNLGNSERKLRLIAFFDLDLNLKDPYFGNHNVYQCFDKLDGGKGICISNSSYLADRAWNAFLHANRPIRQYAFERRDFIGNYGCTAKPEAIGKKLSNNTDSPDNPALTAAWELKLGDMSRRNIYLCFGNLINVEELPTVMATHGTRQYFRDQLRQVRYFFRQNHEAVHVSTPDPVFDRFVNTWLKHQLCWCAYWNRGWDKGFRDGMQDALAYLPVDPEHVRDMISDALPHQYADGRTVRKWAKLDTKAYNDGPGWLALTVAAYIRETGDKKFLQRKFPFLDNPGKVSVLEHVMRGLRQLNTDRGPHGMCRMPFGDWNDGLTGPGKEGMGESVWTTMQLAAALREFAPIADFAGAGKEAEFCRLNYRNICKTLKEKAWNGQWYNRAFTDRGRAIGHPRSKEGRIWLLPQAWSIISEIAAPKQREKIIDACIKFLLVEHGFLIYTPPFHSYDPEIGHVSGNLPGLVENGGNYCHASAFMIYALCLDGRENLALEIFHRILPVNPMNPPAKSWQEPFSVTNSYRGPEAGRYAGRGMFSWRTGTAGWMFRTALEGILGIRAQLDGLEIIGKLPETWPEVHIIRQYRGREIAIEIRRTGRNKLSIDGKEQKNPSLAPAGMLRRDGTVVYREII